MFSTFPPFTLEHKPQSYHYNTNFVYKGVKLSAQILIYLYILPEVLSLLSPCSSPI